MEKMLHSWATLTLLVGLATFAFAQAPTARPKIKGYSPEEITNLKWTSPRSTGLSNVGIGQLIYVVDSLGNVAGTTFSWSLTARPTGSNAVLDSANKWQTTFKPDVAGRFTVQLVLTTAGGTSSPRAVTINAGKFVGLGEMSGGVSNPSEGQCALCHPANFSQYAKTGHSTMLSRGLDGQLSPDYRQFCLACHTVGYDDTPSAANDGFDDVQKEVGWQFPTTLQAGNWEALKLTYPKLAQRGNIQCESCHGPGSEHKGVKAGIAVSLDASACGYCHEKDPYLGGRKNTQWKNSLHAIGVASASTSTSCNRCHSGWGFIDRIDKKAQADWRLGSPQISCAVCHDPHNADLPHQVRSLQDVTLGDSVTVVNYGGKGKVCMQCHISRRDAVDYSNDPANLNTRFGPHHSNQADMIDGSNAINYGIPIGTSGHKFAAPDLCVTCHMQPTVPENQPGYDKVGEHTWAMRWDGGTPTDPTDDVEHVAVCQTCHGPIESFDDIKAKADWDEDGTIEGTRHEVEGLAETLDKLLPPRTNNTVIGNNYNWTVAGLTPEEVVRRKAYTKAWYNLLFVEEDGSMGVHNAGFSIALLRRSIESITTGDIGAVSIIGPIKDVPNDQGKQVRVMWSKAAGDGISTNPVAGYSLWRRFDGPAGASAAAVASKQAMFAQGLKENVGKRFTIAQAGSWDFVAWVPATGFEFYSVVAPTLYDSTATDGIRWSFFFVTAHAGSQIYESAPDSGYSVDNLAPFAPSNVVASLLPNRTISLGWDVSVDEDFQYFAIYRSTTAGFDPKGAKPLATLTGINYNDTEVTPGSQYYYRISAYDFAGNESKYSPELNVLVTSVAERGDGTPTKYALEQNYPNPFNPETAIRFQLPASSHVRLSIYTALAQEIRVLVDDMQSAAYHVVVWDGRDNAGNPLPSGVYFYRLETEKFTAIKKMVMMK
jgi:hypothetical protein